MQEGSQPRTADPLLTIRRTHKAAWKQLKIAAVTTAVIAAAGITAFLIFTAQRAAPARLLDGTQVVLEKVNYGTMHTPPKAPLEGFLRSLPAKWLTKIKWNASSGRSNTSNRAIFTFWLKFSNPAAATQSIGYAIADENGFEAQMIFEGPYWAYQPAGFGTNQIGLVRGSGTFPHRSRKFFLRLYQQDGNGKQIRVAEFTIKNAGFKNAPGWKLQPLPIEQHTNGLVFSLVKAKVGVAPPGPVLAQYSLQAGQWSEFRFRISEHGRPSAGWSINEMLISDGAGNRLRVSAEDNGAFNNQVSWMDGEECVCLHRWEFWPEEPAWKLNVHFEHPAKASCWVEYLVRPSFHSRFRDE